MLQRLDVVIRGKREFLPVKLLHPNMIALLYHIYLNIFEDLKEIHLLTELDGI